MDLAAAPPEESHASTRRTLVLVTVGRMAFLAVWFVGTMLLIRHLPPAEFGLYAVCVTAIRIVSGCLGDALDRAVMREVPLHIRSEPARALDVVHAAFWIRLGIGLALLLIGAIVPGFIARGLLGSGELIPFVALTAAGILGDLLLRSVAGFFQASERFAPFMALDFVWQVGRFAAVAVLIATGRLSARSGLIVYVAVPYMAFVLGVLLLPADARRLRRPHRSTFGDIFHYSKWLVLALALAAVYERLDVLLLEHFRGLAETGIYAAALQLATIPDFVNSCVQTVLTPKVPPAYADGTFAQLNRRYWIYAVPMAIVAGAGALLLARPVITILLRGPYVQSIPAFQVLVVATLFTVAVTPLSSALLAFTRPRWMPVLNFVALVIIGVGGVLLIPRFGVMGAAMLILIARGVVGIAAVVLVVIVVRQRPSPARGGGADATPLTPESAAPM